jgi:hypothetical protein
MDKCAPPSTQEVPQRVIDRVFDRVNIGLEDDCWPWKLSIGNHGYGQIGWRTGDGGNAGTTAHRVVWMSVNGYIPKGMTVDHICKNRPCCNPNHLRLLSNVDNAIDNGQGRKTHCPRGHEYQGSNLYIDPDGARRCRACAKITANKRKSQ